MNALEEKIGYNFKDKKYLSVALTHSSFANEKKGKVKSNERLEFLGDAVLSIVVSDYIFKKLPDLPEGELTKLRASLVCEKSLCGFANVSSMGICISGISVFCPEKRNQLSKLAFRGMIGGFVVSLLSALVVGIMMAI